EGRTNPSPRNPVDAVVSVRQIGAIQPPLISERAGAGNPRIQCHAAAVAKGQIGGLCDDGWWCQYHQAGNATGDTAVVIRDDAAIITAEAGRDIGKIQGAVRRAINGSVVEIPLITQGV